MRQVSSIVWALKESEGAKDTLWRLARIIREAHGVRKHRQFDIGLHGMGRLCKHKSVHV